MPLCKQVKPRNAGLIQLTDIIRLLWGSGDSPEEPALRELERGVGYQKITLHNMRHLAPTTKWSLKDVVRKGWKLR